MFPTSVFILVASFAMQAAPATPADEGPRAIMTRSAAEHEPPVVGGARGMVIASHVSREIVVARVGADGKIVLGCVDSDEAAKRFLTAPRERVATHRAQEH